MIEIWCCLQTPDARSNRHWVLRYKGKYYKLPIRYAYGSRFWTPIERWLDKNVKWFDIGF